MKANFLTSTYKLQLDNAFWQFSLSFYDQPGVAGQCLDLQNQLRLDVNLVLLCIWLGSEGKLVTREFFAGLLSDTVIDQLRVNIILPLRKTRTALTKQGSPKSNALAKLTLALEILAEQYEQAEIYGFTDGFAAKSMDNVVATVKNLCFYLSISGLKKPNWHHISILLKTALPSIDEAELIDVLRLETDDV
jgi:uncharacterized protein (TIGR02444 family)